MQALGENSVMQAVMHSLDFLQGSKLALPLTFVSALVTSLSGKQFAAQFIAAGGATPASVQRRVTISPQCSLTPQLCQRLKFVTPTCYGYFE